MNEKELARQRDLKRHLDEDWKVSHRIIENIRGLLAGVATFLGLTDVTEPSYTGHAGEVVKVNTAETGLEFGVGGGGGDMTKAVYDTDNDGKVDQAENADTVDNKHLSDLLEGIYDVDYRCLWITK